MKKHISVLFLVAFCTAAFAQRSGISGQIYWITPEANTVQSIPYNGLPLEIFVHELTSMAEVDTINNAISKIYTPVVSRFFCKRNGSFKSNVPPGSYSVFVKTQSGYYGNLQDASGNLSPAMVTEKKNAWITIMINYENLH